ncbi:MAG: DUF3048 domain-containing protein [Patescibacteria group bacterium]
MKKVILENKEKKTKINKNTKFFNILSTILIFSGFILLIIFVYFNLWLKLDFFNQKENNNQTQEKSTSLENNCKYRRYLDGVCVNFEKDLNPDLVAVMIENHTDARPQSGLDKAQIVYEAPVEANYSRFMAIFLKDDLVEKVGPVRSARPYYLDWLQEYGKILYAHVGGSSEALARINSENIFDMNEFYRGSYFWRSSDRFAPHNAYTSSQLWQADWDKYANDAVFSTSSWRFGDVEKCQENCINNIYISFLEPSYNVEWKYNTSTEKYLRYQVGQKHLNQDGTEIFADTIIIQYVNSKVIDEVGRLDLDTIGSGKVEIYQKGQKNFGFWKKDNLKSKTRFYNENDKEIILNSGKIWLEIVNQNCEVKDY